MAQLSNRYATALFSLAIERGTLQASLDEAVLLQEKLSDAECQRLLLHPGISASEKKNFFDMVFKGQISTDMLGFLHLTVEKNRVAFILPALAQFVEMAKQHMRRTTAKVIAAVPLQPAQISSLEALLSEKLTKQVELDLHVDPDVIGGLYIEVDGYGIDRTVKTRLLDMKKSMGAGEMAII